MGFKKKFEMIQTYSCFLVEDHLFFATVLNEFVKMNVFDGRIEILSEIKADTSSINTVFYVQKNFYFIENYKNEIKGINGETVISFDEIPEKPDFVCFAKQFDEKIFILFGDGYFFYDVDLKNGKYKCIKKSNFLSFVTSNERGFFYISKEKKLVFSFYSGEQELVLEDIDDANRIVDVFLTESNEVYYLFEGGIVWIKKDKTRKPIVEGDFSGYRHLHIVNDRIILIPKEQKLKILSISLEENSNFIELYPKEFEESFTEEYYYVRSIDIDNRIIYPMRGMNYFTLIDKNSGEVSFISPQIDKELDIHLMMREIKIKGLVCERINDLPIFLEVVKSEKYRK